jgi:hypothetical protein
MWHLINELAKWLMTTQLSHDMAGGWKWGWATCETLHFVGLCLLLGSIGVLDLRMLGFAKHIPPGAIHKMVPWGVAGFVINLVTGAFFFIGAPYQYVKNIAFLFKLIFIMIAGFNILYFYLGGVRKQIENLGPDDNPPLSAKVVSWVSIVAWFGVIYWGRMLPFVGNAF